MQKIKIVLLRTGVYIPDMDNYFILTDQKNIYGFM